LQVVVPIKTVRRPDLFPRRFLHLSNGAQSEAEARSSVYPRFVHLWCGEDNTVESSHARCIHEGQQMARAKEGSTGRNFGIRSYLFAQ
jgi:hypothetical protein